jgi:hypothetical protein
MILRILSDPGLFKSIDRKQNPDINDDQLAKLKKVKEISKLVDLKICEKYFEK